MNHILNHRLSIEKNNLNNVESLNESEAVKKHLRLLYQAKVDLLEDLIMEFE